MRKVLALFLMISLVFTMTGCSQKESATSGPVTITIWHDKEDAVIAVLEEAVKSLQPNINVVFEKKSGMTESLKLVGNDRNAAPDMYFFAHDKIGVYAEMGVIAPITDFVDVSEQAGYELYGKVPLISLTLWSKLWSKRLQRLHFCITLTTNLQKSPENKEKPVISDWLVGSGGSN